MCGVGSTSGAFGIVGKNTIWAATCIHIWDIQRPTVLELFAIKRGNCEYWLRAHPNALVVKFIGHCQLSAVNYKSRAQAANCWLSNASDKTCPDFQGRKRLILHYKRCATIRDGSICKHNISSSSKPYAALNISFLRRMYGGHIITTVISYLLLTLYVKYRFQGFLSYSQTSQG